MTTPTPEASAHNDRALLVLSVLAVCLAATVYPSRQAGRLDPAEALRHQ